MKHPGDPITWNGKSGELRGVIREVIVNITYVVDIDGSDKQMTLYEQEKESRQ